MKKRLYLVTVLVSLAVLSLSSCLKDPRYYTFANVGSLVELPLGAANGLGNLTPEALPISATPQTIQLVVNIASPNPLSTATTVTLAIQQSAIDAYNTANGTTYVMLPSADYSVASLKVTIPAGQREAILPIQVNTNLIDPSGLFMLPFTIVDGGGVKISNYNTILYAVGAKNQYDGAYSAKGFLVRLVSGAPDLTYGGPFSGQSYRLSTTGASTDAFTQNWANNSEVSGINPLVIAVDGSNNVTVTSTINTTLANVPGYPSRYDPSTQTFYLSFSWNTPGTRIATDTLTYTGP